MTLEIILELVRLDAYRSFHYYSAGAAYITHDTTETFADILLPSRGVSASGDVVKAVQKIYELSCLPHPPLRLVLGKDSLAGARRQLQLVTGDIDTYETWSDDLMED